MGATSAIITRNLIYTMMNPAEKFCPGREDFKNVKLPNIIFSVFLNQFIFYSFGNHIYFILLSLGLAEPGQFFCC